MTFTNRTRYALLALLGAAVAVALAGLWLFWDAQRQDKYIRTTIVLFVAGSALLLWVALVAPWSRKTRWTFFSIVLLLLALPACTLRITGVTGDLLPILDWRWHSRVSSSQPVQSIATASVVSNTVGSFPQFMGPERNGVISQTLLARDWQSSPPVELWRHSVGGAWSGFAVVNGRAVTQEQHGDEETVTCYVAETGALLWRHADPSHYNSVLAGEGPRATPTIVSNRVYTMGGRGRLNCLDLQSGRILWSHDLPREFNAPVPEWGFACSPLIIGSDLLVTVGGRGSAMVAFDVITGARRWASGQDSPHWCSPVFAHVAGVPQVVVFGENVSSYDPYSGTVLWQYPWRNPYPHVSSPALVTSNRVLISQGYGVGSELLEISGSDRRFKAARVWKSNRLKSKFANLIVRSGYVYGLDDGMLVCVDLASGELKWKGERYGHGQLLLVGDLLLVTAESGEIVLVDAQPDAARELARYRVFTAKTWNPPALARDVLFLRNDREAAALRLPLRR